MTIVRHFTTDTFPIPMPGPPSREALVGTFPAGAYRIQVEADGVTLWRTDAPASETRDGGPRGVAAMQAANVKHYARR